jgi:hypothetical protein
MVAFPMAIGVTVPVEFIVALEVFILLQTPLLVAFDSVMLEVKGTTVGPDMALTVGIGFTIFVVVAAV